MFENPLEDLSPIVSFITLGPAKPIKAPGSAIVISPSIAKDALTPPVVGSVKILYKEYYFLLIYLQLLQSLATALRKNTLLHSSPT